MKNIFTIYLLIFLFTGGVLAQSSWRSVEPGKVLVKLRPDAEPTFERRMRTMQRSASDTSVLRVGLKSFDQINRKYRASNMRRVFPDAGKYEAKHRKYGLHLWYEITIPEGENPKTVASSYGVDENVQMAEPRYTIRSLAMTAIQSDAPDDPGFVQQWNYNNTGQTGGLAGADIRLLDAWKAIDTLGLTGKEVIVAVVDGGVYYDHEDLNMNMWTNFVELNGTKGVDDDGNGYIDDLHGYNFVSRTSGVISPENHATHVAGIIAAVTNNGTGVSGISGSPEQGFAIKIMNTQIMVGSTRSVVSTVEAYTYAADNGAVISQNSWGYNNPDTYSQSDVEAINYFINEAGRDEQGDPRPGTPMVGGIVIFAAGNDETDENWYPARFDNVLAVAATNHYGKLAWYSNYGDWVDISAPGGDTDEAGKNKTGGIYSTSWQLRNKNYYEYIQGTSMACPHVSGVAALILSVLGNESFTPDMLRDRLLNSATPLDVFDSANASKMGSGLVNAEAALIPAGIPGSVTDLIGSPINHISAEFTWTVPLVGNDGKVRSFVVACSTNEITKDNFSLYAGKSVLSTINSGDEQQYTITGLNPSTAYYTAVQSISSSGDRSEISNVISFTTYDNHAPREARFPTDTILIPYNPAKIKLSEYFADPDGDKLSYICDLSRTGIVDVAVKGDTLVIDPQYHGFVTLQVTAADPYSGAVKASVDITVEQKYSPDKADELMIYPNPTNDVLYYSFVLSGQASVWVRIVNSAGSIIYQTQSVNQPAGTYYYNLNLSTWSGGMYILQYFKNGEVMDAKKIIKL